jgi:hypothetical protein
MATMVSGSPLASRRAVRISGRSRCVSSVGALQAACADASGALGCGKADGITGRGGAAITAGVAAGIAVGAAISVTPGATIRAGSSICACACAAAKVAKTAEAAAARATRAIVDGLLGDINASFAFSWRPDVLP